MRKTGSELFIRAENKSDPIIVDPIIVNISEGYGTSKLQFKRYLKISKGSVKECIALATLSRLRGYIDTDILF